MTDEVTPAKHVLVIGDEPDFAALLRSILIKAGYSVSVAYSGEDAFSMVREVHKRRPDIITLDIHMPRKSGVFFYRRLMENRAYHDIPVVVVTSVTRDNEMEKIVKRLLETDDVPPPRAYIEKPVDGSHFLESLEEAIMSSKSARC